MKTTCCFQQSHLLCAARIIQNVKIQENEDSLMSFPHIMDILEIYAEDKCFLKSSCHLLLWGHSHDFCPLLHCSSDTPLLHSGSPFPVHSSLFYCPSKLYGRSSCQFSPVLASCVFLHFIVFLKTQFSTLLCAPTFSPHAQAYTIWPPQYPFHCCSAGCQHSPSLSLNLFRCGASRAKGWRLSLKPNLLD